MADSADNCDADCPDFRVAFVDDFGADGFGADRFPLPVALGTDGLPLPVAFGTKRLPLPVAFDTGRSSAISLAGCSEEDIRSKSTFSDVQPYKRKTAASDI